MGNWGIFSKRAVQTSATTCAVFLLLGAAHLAAQTYTGQITGIVTDQTGAVLPGVQVTLTNTATSEVREAVTDDQGRYRFTQLLSSTYSLRATLSGFTDYRGEDFRLSPNQVLEINPTLALGGAREAVEVIAGQAVLDTQTANQISTLSTREVERLPVLARVPLANVHTEAGVVAPRTGVSTATQDQNHNRFSINGGRDMQMLAIIDGVTAVSGDWGGLIASPAVDSVSEIQVIRNAYDAQYGRTGGGVVLLTTKSGSQEYHGTLSEFHQNDNLNANGFFNNRNGIEKEEFKRNVFGGNIGGPILRAKRLFGFFGYEGLRQTTPANRVTRVPTARERSGDFSQTFNTDGTPVVIFDPLTTRPDPNNPGRLLRDAFPQNRIPQDRLDPVAVSVLERLPRPNQAGRTPAGLDNLVLSGFSNVVQNDRYDGRIDWVSSNRHTLFGRFTKASQDSLPATIFDPLIEPGRSSLNPRWTVAVGNTFIVSPTMVVDVLVGGGKWTESNIPTGFETDLTPLGLPASIVEQFDVPTPPQFALDDFQSLGSSGTVSVAARSVATANINATKDLGAHVLKFGWSLEHAFLSQQETISATFNFDRFFTSGPDPDVRGDVASGNTIASFLLGNGAIGEAPRLVVPSTDQAYWSFYIHDTWNASPRLTVNVGLRYGIQRARTERRNRVNWFDGEAPSPLAELVGLPDLKGGLRFANEENRGQWETPLNNFAPRLGLAYKIADTIVARAGYGIYYVPTVNVGPFGNDGFSATTPWVSTLDDGRTPHDVLSDPFPDGLVEPAGADAGLATAAGLSIRTFQRERPTPYYQQYSADVQFELPHQWLLQLGYAGSQGRKLAFGFNGFAQGLNINQLPASALAMGQALREQVPNPFSGVITTGPLSAETVERRQLLRPYPQFLDVNIFDMPGASSSFNAFLVKVDKRFSDGLSFRASYQYSKATDNASENQGWEVNDRARNVFDLDAERSVSAHDVPHSLAVAAVYELPVGRGRHVGSNLHPVVDAMVGGWETAVKYTMASGLPLLFGAPNNSFSFSSWQFPNITPGADLTADNRTVDRWFNTDAFEQPADFIFGNAPRFVDDIRYSRTNNWDVSISKTFRSGERLRWQFRAELFNALNSVQFGRANTEFGSPDFGRVTSNAPGNLPRTIQLALKMDF